MSQGKGGGQSSNDRPTIGRRGFLKGATGAALGAAVAGPAKDIPILNNN